MRPVFVHLGSPERAKLHFDYYNLSDVERISNPQATLYQLPVFALSRGNPYLHFLNPTVWKGWLNGAIYKYRIGMIKEDADQMPGVFFLKERKIVRAFRHRTIADEPDYLKLIGAGQEDNAGHRSVKEVSAQMYCSAREPVLANLHAHDPRLTLTTLKSFQGPIHLSHPASVLQTCNKTSAHDENIGYRFGYRHQFGLITDN